MALPPASDEVFSCRLVGPFSILVQVLVGTLGFSTLVIKRHFERPRRRWLVWGFDVSKQVAGGTVMHMANLLASALSGSGAEQAATNPCSWYVLNLTLDCTLGVLFVVGYLRLFELLAARLKIRVLPSGDYGTPPDWREWAKQGLMFLFSMVGMKLTVVLIQALAPALVALGDLILKPVQALHSPRLEIVFVMAFWPLALNITESWVLDQIIKKKGPRAPAESDAGHMPVSTDDIDAAQLEAYAMHDAAMSSGSRTLAGGSTRWDTRLSLESAEFSVGSVSDGSKSAYDDADADETAVYYRSVKDTGDSGYGDHSARGPAGA
ncbi:hypothetical protein IWQ56_000073 [Coemansia nantahalensis]|nr:hypothetical protein IWQ56_000073 [Coemansia nantahalensis]